MNIKESKRFKYDHNPLVEVLCQIRFDPVLRLVNAAPDAFQQIFAKQYPNTHVDRLASFQVTLGSDPVGGVDAIPQAAPPSIYHFLSENRKSKVSISAEFITFSCEVYERWEGFKESATEAFRGFLEIYSEAVPHRVGLRYRDLIVRENLGLVGVSWGKLLTPFVAGVFALEDFFETPLGIADEAHIQQASQATLRLDECELLVQSAMLRSTDAQPQSAFLIDSDFFRESTRYDLDRSKLSDNLEALHGNANALFRRCITETLHDALGPRPI